MRDAPIGEAAAMQLAGGARAASTASARSSRTDLVARSVIIGSGIAVCLLLAWGHLGLGAYLFPPAPSAPRQVAIAGPYQVTMSADSGQLLVGAHNSVSFVVRDRAGHAVNNAMIQIRADMTTMAMPVPPVTATPLGDGRYAARPLFSMAGPWRLTVTIADPGAPATHAAFDVSVRWNP